MFLILMLVNPAYAVVSGSNGAIKLVDEGKINSTTLESKLDEWLTKNPAYGNVEDYINQTSKNVWVYRQRVECGKNSTLIFDSADDCTELRLSSTIGSMGGHVEFGTLLNDRSGNSYGTMIFRNVTVIGWNDTTNSVITNYTDMTKIETYNVILDNVSFKAVRDITCYNKINADTGKVTNITIDDSQWGLSNYNINNVNFSNIKCNNISFAGFALRNCTSCELYNYKFWNDVNFRSIHDTSANGISISDGHNNYMHDLYIDSPRWGGIYFSGLEHDSIIKNATVTYAGHNGIDVHGGYNLTIQNVTANKSYSNNFLISGPYNNVPTHEDYGVYNVTFHNISTYSPSACGVAIDTRVSHIYINNVSVANEPSALREGIKVLDCDNVTVTGFKNDGQCSTPWCITTYANKTTKDITLIDSSIYNSSYKDVLYQKSSNAKILNTQYGKSLISSDSDYFKIYYLDLVTKYKNGSISPNMKIVISSNNSNYQSQDGNARNKTIFYTDSKGRTYLPNDNRSNSPAIVEHHKNLDGKYDFLSNTINIVSPNNNTISLSGITPDSSWYRKNPNIPTYTITAIIPDKSSKGPHIIGFAPSTDNPFNPGEKKNFRVWTDGTLKEMKWFVNEKQVANGTLNYTCDVSKNVSKIEFRGVSTNKTVVSQVWNFGEDSSDKTTNQTASNCSTSDDSQTAITEFLPENNSLTKNVSEPTTFNVNSSQLLTKNWYINGTLAQDNTTTMTKSWNDAGKYNVTFNGSTGEEPVTNTWIVNVTNSSKYQNKSIISITPEYQVVSPKKQFALNIKVEPGTSIKSTQSDLLFQNSMVKVGKVNEGKLFSQSGAKTYFKNGTVNSSAGRIKQICGSVRDNSSVSSPGTFATINLTAGSRTGVAKFNLSNVVISDSDSNSLPYAVKNVTVLVDTAPVLGSIGSKSIYETKKLTFNVKASDADGNRLILSASGLPSGAKFNQTTGTFTWTPSKGKTDTYTVAFKVSDGYLTDSEKVRITVKKLNNAPVITSFEPANGSVFNKGQQIKIAVKASDADKQTLNYTIKIDGTTRSTSSSYIWKTNYSSSGKHKIEVTVSDGIEKVKKVNTISINNYCPR